MNFKFIFLRYFIRLMEYLKNMNNTITYLNKNIRVTYI